MKDGRKYKVHQKGDREIISVSLPFRHGELLEKCTEHYNASRSEIVAKALTLFFTNIGMEVRENEHI